MQALKKQGIIEKVDKPTDWVSHLVIVKKPSGKLRLCLDPHHLNQAIKRPQYQMPIIE